MGGLGGGGGVLPSESFKVTCNNSQMVTSEDDIEGPKKRFISCNVYRDV